MARVLVALDNFNRASLGADWSQLNAAFGSITIVSSTVFASSASVGSNEAAAGWVGAGSFNADQYAECALSNFSFLSVDYCIGVICRASADTGAGRDFYFFYVASDTAGPNYTTVLGKVVNGTRTVLHSTTVAWANGDLISLEVEGTTLRGCKNGTPLGGSFTQTDTSLSSGQPGALANGGSLTGDDWTAGNIAPSPPTFSSHPQGAAAAVGATASFAVTSADATSYQWQVSVDSGLTWSNVTGGSGGTTASYTTPVAAASDNGEKYRCVATNAGGDSNSLDAWFHVSGLPSAGKGAHLALSATFDRVANRWGINGTSPLKLLQKNSVINEDRNFAAARNLFFFEPPVPAALAGDATTQSTAAGNLTAFAPVYAPRLIASRRARPGRGPYSTGKYFRADTRFKGAIAAPAALAGAGTAQATASGTLTTAIPLNGVALVVANASGALSTGISLAGSVATVVSVNGNLTAQIRLNGAAIAQALAAAGLTTQIVLAAAAQVQATATGALGVPGAALAGNAQGQAAAAGALSTGIAIAGAAQGSAIASGSLTTAIALGGNAAATALAQASLTAQINLNGAAIVQALAAAGLATQINLGGNAQAQVTAAGALAAPSALAGNAVAQAQATGSLSTAIRLAGAAQDQASATGSLAVPINLAGAAVMVVSGSGALTASIVLNADALARVLATGDLVTHIPLSGAVLTQAAASGALAVNYTPTLLPRYRIAHGHRDLRIARQHRNLTIAEAA